MHAWERGTELEEESRGMFRGSGVGEAGVCVQRGAGWGSLCAKRGPGRAGRLCTSLIAVAEEGADGTVEMRGWEGKGRYPLVPKGEGRATNRGTELGKQGPWTL